MVSSSGGTHWTFWLYSSYIATVFSPHFCFIKSPLSEPVTRLNWYFWLLRLKYPAPVIWAISLSNSLLGDSFHTQLKYEFIYSILQKKREARGGCILKNAHRGAHWTDLQKKLVSCDQGSRPSIIAAFPSNTLVLSRRYERQGVTL